MTFLTFTRFLTPTYLYFHILPRTLLFLRFGLTSCSAFTLFSLIHSFLLAICILDLAFRLGEALLRFVGLKHVGGVRSLFAGSFNLL